MVPFGFYSQIQIMCIHSTPFFTILRHENAISKVHLLFRRFIFFRVIASFFRPPAPACIYIATFSLQVYIEVIWEFPKRRGYGPEYASLGHHSAYPCRLDRATIATATLRAHLTICMLSHGSDVANETLKVANPRSWQPFFYCNKLLGLIAAITNNHSPCIRPCAYGVL